MRIRRLAALATAAVGLPFMLAAPAAHAATFTGTIQVGNSLGSVTSERFLQNNCVVDPSFQGIDGYVFTIPAGTTHVTVTTSTPGVNSYPWGSYDIWFYDHCPTLPDRALDPGYFSYKAGTGTQTVTLLKPAKWGVIHLGTGAQMKFTYTTG
jgi:hypothetical protein